MMLMMVWISSFLFALRALHSLCAIMTSYHGFHPKIVLTLLRSDLLSQRCCDSSLALFAQFSFDCLRAYRWQLWSSWHKSCRWHFSGCLDQKNQLAAARPGAAWALRSWVCTFRSPSCNRWSACSGVHRSLFAQLSYVLPYYGAR